MKCDFVVEGRAVVCVDADFRVFEPGFVAVKDGAIAEVGPASATSAWEPARRLGGPGCLVMPGFVNTHTHIAMAAFRGACEDVEDRLTRVLFPMEKRLVDRKLVYEASRLCLAEMARSGTTCFADMYYFEDEVARAAREAGLRCLLGETIVDFAAPDAAEPYGGLEYGRRFVEEWRGDGLVRPCLAPHAPYTVDGRHLGLARDEAERLGVPLLIHLAEGEREADRFRASHGSVVKYLDSIGFLGPRVVAAHVIHVDAGDIALLAERDVAVAHCPASNAKSGRPIAPAADMVAAGLRLGLATDGPISGNGMDMQGIVGLHPKLQKLLARSRLPFGARDALRAATLGGAEALGLGARTGSLETGKLADLITVDADATNMVPNYDWYATIAYAMRPHNVRDVLVDGELVVDAGRVTGFDEEDAKAAMRDIERRCRGEIAELMGGLR